MNTLEQFAAIVFWSAIAVLFYIYIGYPVMIGFLAKLRPNALNKTAPRPSSLSILISCYNDQERLAEKLRNILDSEGAGMIREILVGFDGGAPSLPSDLATHPVLRVYAFPERRGKPSVLNDLMGQATGEILVMMDIRQRLDRQALSALIENFRDPGVGVVSGELVFEATQGAAADAASIDAYWRMEKWLRQREAQFASVPGATGALYAIRRELASPIPPDAALDDVLIPMQAIAKGYRCIFDPAAKIYDLPATDAAREAVRKRRTLAGNVQLIRYHPAWLLPFGHPIWWQFGSHKIARLFSPVMMIIAAASNGILVNQPVYDVLAALHVGAYAVAAAGLSPGSPAIIRKLGVFLRMQATLLMAWKDGLSGKNLARWEKA